MASAVELSLPRNDRNPPSRRFHAEFDHVPVFLVRQRGGLARGSAGNQCVRSSCDLPFDQRHKRLLVHFPVAERGYEGGMEPLKTMAVSGGRDEDRSRDSRDNHSMRGLASICRARDGL